MFQIIAEHWGYFVAYFADWSITAKIARIEEDDRRSPRPLITPMRPFLHFSGTKTLRKVFGFVLQFHIELVESK